MGLAKLILIENWKLFILFLQEVQIFEPKVFSDFSLKLLAIQAKSLRNLWRSG